MPKRQYIEKMFDGIAPSYDKFNHLMSLGIDRIWRRRSLRHVIDRERPQRILDVACGTGDYSIAIARRMLPGGSLTAMDISEGMTDVMRRKVRGMKLPVPVEIVLGDCETSGFEGGSFDVVTVAFGIRNFERREAALREMLRVTRPGGRIVILELSTPERRLPAALYDLYASHVMPAVGGWLSGDRAAYKYLPASVKAFPRPQQWMRTMRQCGWTDVIHQAYTFGLCRLYVGWKGSDET